MKNSNILEDAGEFQPTSLLLEVPLVGQIKIVWGQEAFKQQWLKRLIVVNTRALYKRKLLEVVSKWKLQPNGRQ